MISPGPTIYSPSPLSLSGVKVPLSSVETLLGLKSSNLVGTGREGEGKAWSPIWVVDQLWTLLINFCLGEKDEDWEQVTCRIKGNLGQFVPPSTCERHDMSQYLLHILSPQSSIKMERYFYYIHKWSCSQMLMLLKKNFWISSSFLGGIIPE